ncbi:MAG: DUF1080 domain-containing protein [Ferruginibacter sp.]
MKASQFFSRMLFAVVVLTALTSPATSVGQSNNSAPNTLTKKEIRDGWKLLFDGKTMKGWRGANKDKFPDSGWAVEEGTLTILPRGKGGDIVTDSMYSNFELTFEFKAPLNANSGVKYFVLEDTYVKGAALGLEYQTHDTGKRPLDDNDKHSVGCLYELLQAKNRTLNPPGEWNTARIVSYGINVQHWLNAKKILEYERGGKEFREAVAKSKFKNYPYFGEALKGHILLQDHGNRTYFRNIKIRALY